MISSKKLKFQSDYFVISYKDDIKTFFKILGPWSIMIDPIVSRPRFSDSSWSIWFVNIRKSRNNSFVILTFFQVPIVQESGDQDFWIYSWSYWKIPAGKITSSDFEILNLIMVFDSWSTKVTSKSLETMFYGLFMIELTSA